MRSLDVWQSAGKDFEVRITCDPRFISTDDLLEIANILSSRGVKNIAIQKYIPHFEDDEHKTTVSQRDVFFTNQQLRDKINSMFPSVIWRE